MYSWNNCEISTIEISVLMSCELFVPFSPQIDHTSVGTALPRFQAQLN